MTTVTLRPNGTILAPTAVVGAANAHTATSDNSDASYTTSTTLYKVDIGTSAAPAGFLSKQFRLRARYAGYGDGAAVILRDDSGNPEYALVNLDNDGATIYDITGAWSWLQPTTQTTVDTMVIAVAGNGGSTRVHELYVDWMYVALPVTAVNAVTPDPYTASTLVPISWTNTLDTDGGAQTRYQMRVFTLAQYSIGGFDPATSPATYDSGEVVSSATTADTGAIPNATYRAYIRVAQTVNGASHWSAYAFDGFVLTAVTSDVLSVTTVASNSTGSIAVTVNRNTGTSAWDYVEVERTLDGGTTWSPVRGASYVDPPLADSFVITDYEVPNGTTVTYRARGTRLVSSLPSTGAWVSSASTSWTSTSTCDAWLKAPNNPTLNVYVAMSQPVETTEEVRRGVFQVIGLASPVVVSDVLGGASAEFEVYAETILDANAIRALIALGTPILIQTHPSVWWRSRYVSVGSLSVRHVDQRMRTRRTLLRLGGLIEVSAPADPLAGV